MLLDDTIVLKTFSSRMEAEIVAGLLNSEGIDAIVDVDRDYTAGYPGFNLPPGIRLIVYRDDEAEARKILQAMEKKSKPK